jgi:hypothetical protein
VLVQVDKRRAPAEALKFCSRICKIVGFDNVPLAARQFTIPPAVLLALPPQPAGPPLQSFLEIDLIVTKQFAAPGMDFGVLNFVWPSTEPFSYQ